MVNARRPATVVLVALLSGFLGSSPVPAVGQSPRPTGDRAQTLRDQIQDASPDEDRLLDQLDEAANRKAALDGQVGEIDARLSRVRSELRAAESHLSALEARQRGAQAHLAEAVEEMGKARERLSQQALAAYVGRAQASGLGVTLLRSRNLGELAARKTYVGVATDTEADTRARWERARDEVEDLSQELEVAVAEATAERDVVDRHRAQVQRDRNAVNAVRQEAIAEVLARERVLGEIVTRKDEFQAAAAGLAQASSDVTATLRQRQGSSSGALAPNGDFFSNPVPGARIGSGFGPRVHPVYGDVRVHTGVDIGASSGSPIRAAADGVVSSAGWLGGYGNATIIEHGGSLATLYAHQSQMLVSAGQRVSGGQVIGRVGCTGTCTGPHLHYEVRIDGTPVNPVPYL